MISLTVATSGTRSLATGSRGSGLVSAPGERNRQVQSEAQGRLETSQSHYLLGKEICGMKNDTQSGNSPMLGQYVKLIATGEIVEWKTYDPKRGCYESQSMNP
jgi:hypothetical protein